MNLCTSKCVIQHLEKAARIIPIHKKENTDKVTYGPVEILAHFRK